jgi:hypothetical protein
LGNTIDHQDLGETIGRGNASVGNTPRTRFQIDNPVEQQERVTVGQICGRIGIKQKHHH